MDNCSYLDKLGPFHSTCWQSDTPENLNQLTGTLHHRSNELFGWVLCLGVWSLYHWLDPPGPHSQSLHRCVCVGGGVSLWHIYSCEIIYLPTSTSALIAYKSRQDHCQSTGHHSGTPSSLVRPVGIHGYMCMTQQSREWWLSKLRPH